MDNDVEPMALEGSGPVPDGRSSDLLNLPLLGTPRQRLLKLMHEVQRRRNAM